jgi:hypothetical protein
MDFFMPLGLCFAENTFSFRTSIYHQLYDRNLSFIKISLVWPIVSNLSPVSYEGNVKHHIRSNIAAPGEALYTVW